jgi:hypothetical protein
MYPPWFRLPTQASAVAWLVLLGGCSFSPHFDDGKVGCSVGDGCPPGLVCAANQLCYEPGNLPDLSIIATPGEDLAVAAASDFAMAAASDLAVPAPDDLMMQVDLRSPCVPTGCPADACGSVPDGCGNNLQCTCSAGRVCGGAGTPGQCCTPDKNTCPPDANCGSAPNGCGGSNTCGTACAPDVCGGPIGADGGTPNFCGNRKCTPRKCESQPSGHFPNCGTLSDGCGAVLDCAECKAGLECVGNVCVTP